MLIHEILTAPSEKTALIFNNTYISYGELNQKIDSFALYLQEKNIKQGERVALLCQNSPEFIYSYFALAKLGAKIIPLNPMLTLDEMEYILKDSETTALVAHDKMMQKMKSSSEIPVEKVIVVTGDFFEDLPVGKPSYDISLEDTELCTILYTSGTTGKPKGAMLSHKNLISNAKSTKIAFEITSDDNFICVLPMFHSFAFTVCIMTPLYSGGTVTIQETFNPKETLNIIQDKEVTAFCGVPSMYNFIAQLATSSNLKSIRLAVSGGAPLPIEILEAFENKFGIPLVEGYGLSEASPVVSFNPLNRERKKGSVGTAIPDVYVKIVDDLGNELPAGEVGELVTKGDNVMIGYLNLPEATAETLKGGWLYTGDIAYIDGEGYIFIVDRKKDLVIVGGLNVYPREIEEVIYTYPGILECAVIGIPDLSRGELIKAYIVQKDDVTIDKKDLLKHLKEKLAIYKLPKTIDTIDSIPKTGTGKIDKKQLRKMAMEA